MGKKGIEELVPIGANALFPMITMASNFFGIGIPSALSPETLNPQSLSPKP